PRPRPTEELFVGRAARPGGQPTLAYQPARADPRGGDRDGHPRVQPSRRRPARSARSEAGEDVVLYSPARMRRYARIAAVALLAPTLVACGGERGRSVGLAEPQPDGGPQLDLPTSPIQ